MLCCGSEVPRGPARRHSAGLSGRHETPFGTGAPCFYCPRTRRLPERGPLTPVAAPLKAHPLRQARPRHPSEPSGTCCALCQGRAFPPSSTPGLREEAGDPPAPRRPGAPRPAQGPAAGSPARRADSGGRLRVMAPASGYVLGWAGCQPQPPGNPPGNSGPASAHTPRLEHRGDAVSTEEHASGKTQPRRPQNRTEARAPALRVPSTGSQRAALRQETASVPHGTRGAEPADAERR